MASRDRPAAIRDMRDEDVIRALAAASRKMDAYLANVLAVEVLRRRRRERAIFWGVVAGAASAILVRTVLFLIARPDWRIVVSSFVVLIPCGLLGWGVYRNLLRRPTDG